MHNKLILTAILAAVTLSCGVLLSGCGSDYILSTAPPGVSDYASPYIPPSPVTCFPLQRPGFEKLAYPAALTAGDLVLENGQLRLADAPDTLPDEESRLLVWPPYFSVQVEDGRVRMLDSSGNPAAQTGDRIEVGGGQITEAVAETYTGQRLPVGCRGPYWLVSHVVSSPFITPAVRTETPQAGLEPGIPAGLGEAEDALVRDAVMYAQAQGVTVKEALRRLQVQESFGGRIILPDSAILDYGTGTAQPAPSG